jgi:hypothetical protein
MFAVLAVIGVGALAFYARAVRDAMRDATRDEVRQPVATDPVRASAGG